ncbi:MAG: BBE domain-containing protein [Actinomycetes bacterium]
MGGAYDRVPAGATAFAHSGESIRLEHVGEGGWLWVDKSWTIARADGSGRVYPNFPDPDLENWATACHGENYHRLLTVKKAYDPDASFSFPQSL